MKVNVPKGNNSVKCIKCGKLMVNKWWGRKCSKCGYEQFTKSAYEEINRVERKQ